MRVPLLVASMLGGCLIGAASGCERLLAIQDPVAGDGPGQDSGDNDSNDGGGLPASSPILLSEVVVSPSDAEMIELVNTSNQTVDLSTYYLSDSANYFRLPFQATVDQTDFIVKFPQDTQLGPHGVLTVSVDIPDNFANRYGMSPNFSVADKSMDRIVVNGTVRLTDTGEAVILFQWDGRSDLVRDVDIMIVGNPSPVNQLINKSGLPQDGPDSDSSPSAYATDAGTIKPQAAAPMPITTTTPMQVFSTQRIALEDGHELHNGTGNGQSGDDETSEDTAATWDGTPGNPFTAPTPGQVPSQLLR